MYRFDVDQELIGAEMDTYVYTKLPKDFSSISAKCFLDFVRVKNRTRLGRTLFVPLCSWRIHVAVRYD